MKKRSFLNLYVPLLLGLTLTNCASDAPLLLAFPEGADPVETMYAAAEILQEREEHSAGQVMVQHLLVGVGFGFADRLPIDAETRAAEILQELAAANGANFSALVTKYTDAKVPGIYTMTALDHADVYSDLYPRKHMVPAFGNAAWRLRVGEIGIAPYDPPPPAGKGTSRFGIHIIKRLL
ncbi:MAG: hypothetical protein CMJ89_04560 [Planctomycetes bacterium]|jgi:hypothetical protein|nr:hypothetical protein [Planctomycetota bacterium]